MSTIITLPESEAYQLASCEGRIEAGLSSFIEVGEALSAIREGKLYRATHGTFEDYCREKWSISSSRARRLIDGAEVAQTVPMGTLSSERQARELSRVEPARREEVVQRAVEATHGKLTAAAIREAAQPVELNTLTASKGNNSPEEKTAELVVVPMHPIPTRPLSPEAIAAGEQADSESGNLWMLKSTWRKTNKKDRAAFIEWASK